LVALGIQFCPVIAGLLFQRTVVLLSICSTSFAESSGNGRTGGQIILTRSASGPRKLGSST
jgi:hypothetical protein